MITRERIRYLLLHNKEIRSNIHSAKRITIEMETEEDVIGAALLPAADYSGDRVQTTHEPSALSMSRVRHEIAEQKADVSMRWFAIQTDEAEIEHLDCAVFSLYPARQQIVVDRFYDRLTMREVCAKRFYNKRTVIRMTNKAIDEITEIFNRHGAASLESEYNDMSAEITTERRKAIYE